MSSERRSTLESLGAGFVMYQVIRWHQYESHVGVRNATIRGFRIWKKEIRVLIRQQPRRHTALGLVCLVVALALYGLANIPDLGVGGSTYIMFPSVVMLVLGIRCLSHRPPPQDKVDEINARHQTVLG